jgi:hypothetical protein
MAVAAAAALAIGAGTLATTPAAADTGTQTRASGSFNVLTYNVAGLPEGLSSATPRRTPR